MAKHRLAGLSLFLIGLAFATAARSQDNEVYQEGWNRAAEYYERVEKGHARRCQAACIDDNQCRSWAYDTTASTDNCRLMSQTPPPPPQQHDCCVTGVKQN